jgi:VWFA-related protein
MVSWGVRTAGAAVIVLASLALSPQVALSQQQPPQQRPPQQNPPQQPPQQQPQPPVFRAGVKVVRVDVSVIGSGEKPVTDLKAADFEVEEDGVPQKIDTAQFVRLDGQPKPDDETSLEIRSRDHSRAEAAREDVRLFVIFLDDYHIDRTPEVTIPLRRALTTFIAKLQPTDLAAIVDPLTPNNTITFTRSQADLSEIIRTFEGRQGEIFPIKNKAEEAQLKSGDVARLRAQVTLSALGSLCHFLGGLREGRKNVIFVSQGPPLIFGSGTAEYDLRDTIAAANRGNVTINVVDPRGLSIASRTADSMYRLAAETGGRMIFNTNNFEIGLRGVVADASAYYLIGYTPSRAEDDGKYHKISVKVKRSGTHVIAREGYWAPSQKQVEAAVEAAHKPQVPGVASAMRAMVRLEPRGGAQAWVGLSRNAEGQTQAEATWEPMAGSDAMRADRLELEVVPAGTHTPTGQPLSLPSASPGKPARSPKPRVVTPGEFLLRFTARSADGEPLDRWEEPLSVPDLSSVAVALATPKFFIASSVQELREVQAAADPTPRALRTFRQTDRVFIQLECYAAPGAGPLSVTAELLSADGKGLFSLPELEMKEGKTRFEIPVRGLGKGTYLFRARAKVGDQQMEHVVGFRVIP